MDRRLGLESSIYPKYWYTDSVNSYTETVTKVSYVARSIITSLNPRIVVFADCFDAVSLLRFFFLHTR